MKSITRQPLQYTQDCSQRRAIQKSAIGQFFEGVRELSVSSRARPTAAQIGKPEAVESASYTNPRVRSVDQFCAVHPAFTPGSMRYLIYASQDRHGAKGLVKANGLASALTRIGRRIYIDEEKFFAWFAQHRR